MKSKSKQKQNNDMRKKIADMRNSLDTENAAFIKRYKSQEDCGETEPSPSQPGIYQRK